MLARSLRWKVPTFRLVPALQLLGLFLVVGLVQGIAVAASMRSEGVQVTVAPIVWNLTGALSAWAAFPLVQMAVANAPDLRVGLTRFAGVHVVGYGLFAALHVGMMLGLRWFVGLMAGSGLAPTNPLRAQVLWQFQSDIILYAGLTALWSLLGAWDERRGVELRTAQLETALANTRLQALTARVDPHFLLNALNTVSSVMREDLDRTEHLLANLGDVLRATLRAEAPTWTVGEELHHARQYMALLQARFEDRLKAHWKVAPDVDGQQIPRFTIQTLLENAVKHNRDRIHPLTLQVAIANEKGALRIDVVDDGCGFSCAAIRRLPEDGGLFRLTETLRLLHGDSAQLNVGAADPHGAQVTITVPKTVE